MSRLKVVFLDAGTLLALMAASWLTASSIMAEPPPAPNRFYGTVTINGTPAPAGTDVTATIGGNNCGQTTVQVGSTYVLDVVSASQTAGCGTEGASVSFTVAGLPAGSATWHAATFTPLDLAAVGTVPPDRFYGTVTINGTPAPAGTDVTATIGGNNCGQTTVQAGSTYVLDVVSASQTAGCGTEGATVNFTVAGSPAGSASWSSGKFTHLDLSAIVGCLFTDDEGRGTTLTIVDSNWHFTGPGVDLSGSGGIRWNGEQVHINARSGRSRVEGHGTCPGGPAKVKAIGVLSSHPGNLELEDETP